MFPNGEHMLPVFSVRDMISSILENSKAIACNLTCSQSCIKKSLQVHLCQVEENHFDQQDVFSLIHGNVPQAFSLISQLERAK